MTTLPNSIYQQIRQLAFSIQPPNPITPQLAQLANAAEAEAERLEARNGYLERRHSEMQKGWDACDALAKTRMNALGEALAERDEARAEVERVKVQAKHDYDADTDCRNLLCEERDQAEKERDALRAQVAQLEGDLAKMTAWRDAAHRDREREEEACLKVMEERDGYHDWADKLADAIAHHMREEIGEHSSANNPWANALNLIDGSYCR